MGCLFFFVGILHVVKIKLDFFNTFYIIFALCECNPSSSLCSMTYSLGGGVLT